MDPLCARPRSRVASLALCCLLVATGCNGTDSPDEGAGEEGEVAANARAAAVNVSLDDLPEGFVAIAGPDGEEDGSAPVEGCIEGFDDLTVTDAASPTFSLQNDTSLSFITSETSILREPDASDLLFDSLQEQPVLDCLSKRLDEVFARLLESATVAIPLSLAPDQASPDVGDRSLRLNGSTTYTQEGAAEPIVITTSLVFVQTGDVLSVLLFGGLLEPFPVDTAQDLVTTVAERQG